MLSGCRRVGSRRHAVARVAFTFLLSSWVVLSLAGGALAEGPGPRAVPGELLVKLRPSVARSGARELWSHHGLQRAGEISPQRLHRIRVPETAREAVRRALAKHPDVDFVEPNLLFEPGQLPNDPQLGLQWAHETLDSDAAWAWSRAHGQVVAILDSGVSPSHPDLASRLLSGWDFWDHDGDPADAFGHGTEVAGVAAGVAHNGRGIAGMAWGAWILPVRVAGAQGMASSWAIAQGLDYAVAQGAGVANVSFSGVAASQTVGDAARRAVEAGTVVVASAGNCSCLEAWGDSPWILTVGATTAADALASFSSRGDHVDLTAPGQGIRTTSLGGGYVASSGTSFAAPLVSGVVALLQAADPELSPQQIESVLASTAIDAGAQGWDSGFGHGRVAAGPALGMAAGGGGRCGLGFELAFVLPLLRGLRHGLRRSSPRAARRRRG